MSVSISRRRFLRDTTLVGAAVPAAGILASTSAAASTPSVRAARSQASTQLQFWSRETWEQGALEPLIRARLSAFDKMHGTQTSVQFMVFQASVQKEQAAIAAGITPDLAQQGPDVSLAFAGAGHLLPINDVYASLKERFLPLQKVAFVTYHGSTYAVPWWTETRVLLYHKDLFAKAGVKPPTTWQEWQSAAKALTKGTQQYGFVIDPDPTNLGQLFIPLATAVGGNLLSKDGALTTATAPFATALRFLSSLFSAKVMPAALLTYNSTVTDQLFLLKKAAMYWTNGAILSTIKAQYPDLLRTLGAVKTPPATAGGVSRSFLGGFDLFVFKQTKHPQAAKQLLEFLFEPIWYAGYLQHTGGLSLPTTKAAAAQPFFHQDPVIRLLIEQQQTSVRYGGTLVGNAPFLGTAEGQLVFGQPVVDVFAGKRSVDAAVGHMFAQLKTLEKQG